MEVLRFKWYSRALMLLIQYLGTSWGKRNRNIEETRKRSNLPTALSFQTQELPVFGECWEHSWLGSQKIEWESHLCSHGIDVRRQDSAVELSISPSFWSCVMDRFAEPRPRLLALGETAQYDMQYRAWGDGGSWFERYIVNVAWLSRFDSEVFRLRSFTYTFHYHSPLAH